MNNTDISKKELAETRYQETLIVKLAYSFIKRVFGPLVRYFWIERVEGLENIPKKGPIIIASNHQSYFDFICFIAVSPRRIHYLAAEKFYKSRFWRPLMNLTGQIKVDRTQHDKSEVYQTVHSVLEQGQVIGIFPEGTRSPDGEIKKPFTGVAKFALKEKVPVVPVGLIGTYEIMSRYDKFPKFKKETVIKIGKPLYFQEYYDKENNDGQLKEVTDKIMLNIATLAGKKYLYKEG